MASTNGTVTSRDHVVPSRSLPSKWKTRLRGTVRFLPASPTARVPFAGRTMGPGPKTPRLFAPSTVKAVRVVWTPAFSDRTTSYGHFAVGVGVQTGFGVMSGARE